MFSVKSSEQVAKYRDEGDNFLKDLKVYEALVAYNKSLCFAEPDTLEISLTFERRSEAFFVGKLYEKCLGNINAAREHGYPQEKFDLLNEREEKCKTLLKDSVSDLKDFPKLSYASNEKIPFIVDCLELREDNKFGRYIITKRNLKPGDVIAIEETSLNSIHPNAVFTRCFNCLKSNMLDLLPSSAFVMFCSSKCCAESYKKFNGKDELIRDTLRGNDIRQKMLRIMSESLDIAGGFNELQKLVDNLDGKTVFDFDFRDDRACNAKKNFLVCASSLMPKTDSRVSDYLQSILNYPEGDRKDFFVKFTSRIILNYVRNGAKLPGRGTNLPDGGLLLPFVGLLNHSCDPNIYASFVDNKCFITVLKPIEAEEQIFINYRKGFMEQAREQRQTELLKSYEFNCECEACVNNYPMPNKLRRIDKSFKLPSFGRFGSNQDLLNELERNNQFMIDNIKHHPCFETAAVLMRNKELIRTVSERASYPFDFISK